MNKLASFVIKEDFMYTWEIEKFLAQHNRIITRDEFCKIINQVDNPQVKDVEHVGECSCYLIKTNDGKDMEVIVKM